ncbi:FAD-dependent oxidoreductase [Fibrella sp. HMF5335]|uniref:FAD-dependent oxidoreductase n=1 Tax=Fibrella rubiginis TaxID=2817060 RepID=A0A939GH56_9BACT|nr:FAD-dependent oxidoreductase [Fibrella rubiginis]MBO0938251.1 FAD-dependent oxidoreductase [Fibrella rubiginis]
MKKALIVGGGIGGLSAGVALRKAQFEVHLAELSQAYDVYGVGIIQPSNALRALDSLGLADACIERGSPYGKVKMCSAGGFPFTEVGTPPMGRLPVHNGISRRILHDVLHEGAQAAGVIFRMGLSVSAIDNSDEGVSVTFTDGSTDHYDLLVGADGVNSHVRKLIFGDHKPRYTGQSVWRYAFERLKELETGYMFMGKQTKAGLIPMTASSMYMFVVSAEGADNPFIPETELVPRLRALLAEYSAPMVTSVVDQITDPKGVIYRPLETLLMPAPWYKGRVVMMGDAVHATIPQLGQGAGLAIEDAVVLGEELTVGDAVSAALDRYMARRYERCKMVVDVSAQVGEWEQLDWQGKLPEEANIGALMGRTLGALGAPI